MILRTYPYEAQNISSKTSRGVILVFPWHLGNIADPCKDKTVIVINQWRVPINSQNTVHSAKTTKQPLSSPNYTHKGNTLIWKCCWERMNLHHTDRWRGKRSSKSRVKPQLQFFRDSIFTCVFSTLPFPTTLLIPSHRAQTSQHNVYSHFFLSLFETLTLFANSTQSLSVFIYFCHAEG